VAIDENLFHNSMIPVRGYAPKSYGNLCFLGMGPGLALDSSQRWHPVELARPLCMNARTKIEASRHRLQQEFLPILVSSWTTPSNTNLDLF